MPLRYDRWPAQTAPGRNGSELPVPGAAVGPMTPPLNSIRPPGTAAANRRSEEHTSELQSLRHLVCRPPTSTRVPYTTLFRSPLALADVQLVDHGGADVHALAVRPLAGPDGAGAERVRIAGPRGGRRADDPTVELDPAAGDGRRQSEIGRAHV